MGLGRLAFAVCLRRGCGGIGFMAGDGMKPGDVIGNRILLTDKPVPLRICLECEKGSSVTLGSHVQWHNYGQPNQMACANSYLVPDGAMIAPSEVVYL